MRKLTDWGWLPLWLAMTVIALWARPPLPIDETRYLSVAWEMWNSGNFLVPHSNGLPYSHKPPLLFWLINFGWWLFGVQEWSARLIPPLSGLLALFLARKLADLLYPERPEVHQRTPFLLLGTIVWAVFSSLTMFDMLLTCSALGAFIILLLGAAGRLSRWWLWYGLVVGAGILAKGPIICIYVLPAALLAPWWSSKLPVTVWRWYGQWLSGVLVAMLVGLAWALPAAWLGGEEYGQAILFGQTAGRMVKSFAHQRPIYWYLLVLPLVLFPWSCSLQIWKRLFIPVKHHGNRFLLSILLPGIVILSLVSGKQLHYLLPLMPVIAILLAYATLAGPYWGRFDGYLFISVASLIGIALVVLPFLPVQGGGRVFLEMLPPWLGGVPLIAALPFLLLRKGQNRITVHRIGLSSIIFFIALHFALAGPLHSDFDAPKVFQAMSAQDSLKRPIYVYPKKLKDQFQFAARLSAPVVPLDTFTGEVPPVAEDGGVVVWYLKEGELPQLPEGTVKEAYKSGYLLLIPGKSGTSATLAKAD